MGESFFGVDLPLVRKDALVRTDVLHLAEEHARLFVVAFQFAFEGEGKLLDEGRVDECALFGMPARLSELVLHIVCGDDAHIIAGDELLLRAHAHRERFAGEQVLRRLVPRAQAEEEPVFVRRAAPCGVHGVGLAVLVIRCDDEHGLGVEDGFCAKILSHCMFISFAPAFSAAQYFVALRQPSVIYSSKQGKVRMRSPSANALLFMPASPLPTNLLQKQNLCGSPFKSFGFSSRASSCLHRKRESNLWAFRALLVLLGTQARK